MSSPICFSCRIKAAVGREEIAFKKLSQELLCRGVLRIHFLRRLGHKFAMCAPGLRGVARPNQKSCFLSYFSWKKCSKQSTSKCRDPFKKKMVVSALDPKSRKKKGTPVFLIWSVCISNPKIQGVEGGIVWNRPPALESPAVLCQPSGPT